MSEQQGWQLHTLPLYPLGDASQLGAGNVLGSSAALSQASCRFRRRTSRLREAGCMCTLYQTTRAELGFNAMHVGAIILLRGQQVTGAGDTPERYGGKVRGETKRLITPSPQPP